MTGLPNKIVLSGEMLIFCVGSCLGELFGEERFGELSARLDCGTDEQELRLPQTIAEIEELVFLCRASLRKPWMKRPAWVSRYCEDVQYSAFCSIVHVASGVAPTGKYRISRRWTSSLVRSLKDAAWPRETRREIDEWLPGLAYTRGYLAWIAQGGHPDFARWIVDYYDSQQCQT